ncbi:MAG: hypothetical protein AAF911_13445 [Planctomycetota bacterium]
MPIEFREVRREEIDDALAFAVDQGADLAKAAVRHQLSLVAINGDKAILGSALHEVGDDARRHIHIHLKPDINPGLGRLLLDRALRKAEAVGIATTQVKIHLDQAEQNTWDDADWLSRLKPAYSSQGAVTPVAPASANTQAISADTVESAVEIPADADQTESESPADPLPAGDTEAA